MNTNKTFNNQMKVILINRNENNQSNEGIKQDSTNSTTTNLTNSADKFIELSVSDISNFEFLFNVIQNSEMIGPNKKFQIFLTDKNGANLVVVNKNNFELVKERIFKRKDEDEAYFLIEKDVNEDKLSLSIGTDNFSHEEDSKKGINH